MFFRMAKKGYPQDLAVPGFWLGVLVAAGGAAAWIYDLGKSDGALEERVAQLEQRVENPVGQISK